MKQWRATKGRAVSDDVIDELDGTVESSIRKMAYRSRIQLAVRSAIIRGNAGDVCTLIEADQKSMPVVVDALRRHIDFGHAEEIGNSASIYRALLARYDGSVKNQNMLDSLQFRAYHPDREVSMPCRAAVDAFP